MPQVSFIACFGIATSTIYTNTVISIPRLHRDATLIMRKSGLFMIFDSPQRGITPGQFAVWYDNEEMIGSGVI